MLSFLFPFVVCVSGVSSANFSLSIPDRFGLATGNESYIIKLHPDIGSPSPPPSSLKSRRNIIFISDALPGAEYEVRIYYTNLTLKNIAVWRGIGYTSPLPPAHLTANTLKNNSNVAIVNWLPPGYGLFSEYSLTLYNRSSDHAGTPLYRNVTLTKNSTSFALPHLIPGGSYEAQVRTLSKHKELVSSSESFASVNFTLKPNLPAKFAVSFRNETTLMIMWHPPPLPTLYTGYKAFIIPPSASESSIFVKKQLDSADAPKATFMNLVPGRPYNIYVQTVSGSEYSPELVDQYRTTPLPPSSLTYDLNSLTTRSAHIEWEPPKDFCEFDAYKISTNLLSMRPVIKFRNESTAYKLNDDAFVPGHTYEVTVKTFSGKVGSRPISVNVTFRPLPVNHLQSIINAKARSNDSISEWNEELIPSTIKWQIDDGSFQDHFKITYYEAEFQNGDSSTTLVGPDMQELHVLLLPGRNYSIVVQAVSHDVESDQARTQQVTKPSTPSVDNIIVFNETDFSITWQSFVDSRQAHYEVNITSEDLIVEPETKITMVQKLSMSNWYPGAAYNVKIVSVNNGVKSAPAEYKHVVPPKPPVNVTVEINSNHSLTVRWQTPTNSIFSAFGISYKVGEDPTLHGPTILGANVTQMEIKEAINGEQYKIWVSTVTHDDVKCSRPQEITYLVPPSPVENIIQFEEGDDSASIVVSFERPPGRIDYYEMKLVDSIEQIELMENVTGELSDPVSDILRINLPHMKPGTECRLHLTSVSRDARSAPSHALTRLRPWITSKIMVIADLHATTSLTLKYTPTSLDSTYFEEYKFQISDSNYTPLYKSASDADREIIFQNLIPGRLYTIRMWTVAGGVESLQSLEKQQRLYPERINHVLAKVITDRSIELTWDEPSGEYDDFEVRCVWPIEGNLSMITTKPPIVFDTLQPSHQYTFTVTVRSGVRNETSFARYSKPCSAIFTTYESIPDRIEDFRPIRVQPSQIEFAWNLPNISHNGILLKYFFAYSLESTTSKDYKTLDIMPAHSQVTIGGLEPGKKYIFTIRAETKMGLGAATEWVQKMPIWAPPRPNSGMVPTEFWKDARRIEIQFRKDFFSEQNGPIIAYTIIVAEDASRDISQDGQLPRWSTVRLMNRWPPYQATEPFYAPTNDTVLNFTIGEDNCHAESTETYCNGPLKSGSMYYVKIRAFTSPDKYVDTGYSLPIATNVVEAFSFQHIFGKQFKANCVYIGLVGCCLIIFAILCVCEKARRTRMKRALNREEIRRIGRHAIHSEAATLDRILYQHHPFQRPPGNCEHQIPYAALYEQQVRLTKTIHARIYEEKSDRVDTMKISPDSLCYNARTGSALNSMSKREMGKYT